MYCRNCGARMLEGYDYCDQCGMKKNTPSALQNLDKVSNEQSKNGYNIKKIIMSLIIVILLMVPLGIGVYAYREYAEMVGFSNEKSNDRDYVEEKDDVERKENSDDYNEKADETEDEYYDSADVRNARWGDSIERIKKYETEDLLEETSDSLMYETSIGGAEAYLIYYFENDELYRVGYSLKDVYSAGQYVNYVYSFANSLTEKYGEPEEGSGLIKFERDSLIESAGEASSLEYGYTAYKYEWYTDRTKILLGANSQNYDVYMILGYQDINHIEESDF